jgi:hypothetical protein
MEARREIPDSLVLIALLRFAAVRCFRTVIPTSTVNNREPRGCGRGLIPAASTFGFKPKMESSTLTSWGSTRVPVTPL